MSYSLRLAFGVSLFGFGFLASAQFGSGQSVVPFPEASGLQAVDLDGDGDRT
jgi:hypothetical protein